MTFPAFFEDVAPVVLFDPLMRFLGASDDGLVRFTYTDVVKLAGHSCPTVAGAFLMTRKALAVLYGDEIPERGRVRVLLAEAAEEGVAGVMAGVASLVTGARGEDGFKGIAGRFDRRGLLHFAQPVAAPLVFERTDSGERVGVLLDTGAVPPDPAMRPLMQAVLAGSADAETQEAFAALWQDRVRRMLIDHADDPALLGVAYA